MDGGRPFLCCEVHTVWSHKSRINALPHHPTIAVAYSLALVAIVAASLQVSQVSQVHSCYFPTYQASTMSLFGLPGGAMIGLAAGVLLIFNGDILGASGIVSSVFLSPKQTIADSRQHWKFVFLAAFLLLDTFVLSHYYDREYDNGRPLSNLAYGAGGLLVGLGTKLGNGCTSGHGICGLARLSKRSFVAVLTFMTWAVFTATISYGIPSFSALRDVLTTEEPWNDYNTWMYVSYTITGIVTAVAACVVMMYSRQSALSMKKLVPGVLGGLLFCAGLFVSRMIYKARVLSFLDVSGFADASWDPTLIYVMSGGLLVSFLSYQWVEGHATFHLAHTTLKHPIHCESCEFSVPHNQQIDTQLVAGAALFGVGWGIGGVCPGPAIFLAGAGSAPIIAIWWPFFLLGSYVGMQIKSCLSPAASQDPSTDVHSTTDVHRHEGSESEVEPASVQVTTLVASAEEKV
jgi:uncharacterized protein